MFIAVFTNTMAAIEEGDENEGISGMINELKEEISELKDSGTTYGGAV